MTILSDNTKSKTDLTEPKNNETESPSEQVDDLGYDVEPSEQVDKPEETEDRETLPGYGDESEDKPEETEDRETLPGYGDESEDKPEDKPEETEDVEKNGQTLKKEDLDKILGNLPEGVNKDKVSKFALDNKMTKEQVQSYVELSKQENADFEAERTRIIKEQRSKWKSDLETDVEFGGENYDKNVHRVAQLLNKHMPNTKKILTDKGSMLPPSLMKDLAKLHEALNPTTTFEQGSIGDDTNDVDDINQMYE